MEEQMQDASRNRRDAGVAVMAEPEAPLLTPASVESGTSAGGAPGTAEPKLMPTDEVTAVGDGRPTLMPPSEAVTAGEGVSAVGATWHNSVSVTALWSINQVRNAFIHVAGVGWRRLYNGRDGSFTALVTLASQARQTGRPVTLREEADGMIYGIYLW